MFRVTCVKNILRAQQQSSAAKQVAAKVLTRSSVRYNSTTSTSPAESSSTASSASAAAPVDPKISAIVEQISKLTLLETSSLISELKSVLNIQDIAFPMGGAGGAPASGSADANADADAAAAAAEAAKPEEKTIFNLKLESFDAKSKPKIIKEVKSLLGLSLVESKKFVESAPKMLKENVTKEDAEKMKSVLEGLGAKITLE